MEPNYSCPQGYTEPSLPEQVSMIIVLTNMIAEITQLDYNQIIYALNLLALPCPHCKCIGMCIFAYYFRKVKNCSSDEKTKLRILRVRCLNEECKKTHAILPSTIVPYSQITMADTIDIIQCESKDKELEILGRNILLDPKDIYRTKRRFTEYWKSKIADIKAAMGDSSFFTACIDKFKRHFMQIPFTLCSSYSCFHLVWGAPLF